MCAPLWVSGNNGTSKSILAVYVCMSLTCYAGWINHPKFWKTRKRVVLNAQVGREQRIWVWNIYITTQEDIIYHNVVSTAYTIAIAHYWDASRRFMYLYSSCSQLWSELELQCSFLVKGKKSENSFRTGVPLFSWFHYSSRMRRMSVSTRRVLFFLHLVRIL